MTSINIRIMKKPTWFYSTLLLFALIISLFLLIAPPAYWLSFFDIYIGDQDLTIQTGAKPLLALAISPQSNLIAAEGLAFPPGGKTSVLVIWDPNTGKEVLRTTSNISPPRSVTGVAFSPNGRMFASAGSDVALWDSADGGLLRLQEGGGTGSISFSPDGKTLAAPIGDQINIWNTHQSKLTRVLYSRQTRLTCVAFSPDGKSIAAGSDSGSIIIWSIPDCILIDNYNPHSASVTSLAYSPNGRYLSSGSLDCSIQVRNIASGAIKTLDCGTGGHVRSISYSPDGNMIASGSQNSTITIFFIPCGKLIKLRGHCGPVNCVAFFPDGKRLASASHDGTIRIWSMTKFWEKWERH
jgi:uncharacterized protein with WD repeat